jgi:hypothetical protein
MKMTARHALSALLAGVAFAASAAQPPATVAVAFGNQQLTLPIPADFESPAVTPKAYMRLFEDMQRPTDRLMAVMLSKDYVAKVRSGDKAAELSRYLVVKANRRFDTEDFTPDDLVQVKALLLHPSAQLLQLQQALLTQTANRLAKDVGKITGDTSTTMHMGDVRSLGVFDEQPNSISIANLETSGSDSKAGTDQYVQVAASAIILIHHKMLALVVYDDFRSQGNIDWAKGVIRDYVKRVNELNP